MSKIAISLIADSFHKIGSDFEELLKSFFQPCCLKPEQSYPFCTFSAVLEGPATSSKVCLLFCVSEHRFLVATSSELLSISNSVLPVLAAAGSSCADSTAEEACAAIAAEQCPSWETSWSILPWLLLANGACHPWRPLL